MKSNIKAAFTLFKNTLRNIFLVHPILLLLGITFYTSFTFLSFTTTIEATKFLKFTSLKQLYDAFYMLFFLIFFESLNYLSIIIHIISLFLYSKAYSYFKKYPITKKNMFIASSLTSMITIYIFIIPTLVLTTVLLSKDLIMAMILLLSLVVLYGINIWCYLAIMQVIFQFIQKLIKKLFGVIVFWIGILISIIPFIIMIKYRNELFFVHVVPVYIFIGAHFILVLIWYLIVKVDVLLPIKRNGGVFKIDRIKKIPAGLLNTLLIVIRNYSDFVKIACFIILYFIITSENASLINRKEYFYILIPIVLIGLGFVNNYYNWYKRVSKTLYMNTMLIMSILVFVVFIVCSKFVLLTTHFYVALVSCILTIYRFKLKFEQDKLSSISFMIILSVLTTLLLGLTYVLQL